MPILIIGVVLILFGLLSIYSVSIHESFTLALKGIAAGWREWDPSNYFYFFRQLKNIGIAVIMGLIVYQIPIKFFQKQRNIIIISIVVFLLQVAVFVPGIGEVFNGARWWINLWITTIQPSEFFKLGYVLFLWGWLIRKYKKNNTKDFFISFIVLNALALFIFLLIPDLGTVLVLWLVGLVMCRYSGSRLKYVAMMFFGGIVAWLIVGSIAWQVSEKFSYISKRFTYFLSSDIDPQSRQIGWQNQQALIAIWGGGFMGKWYGKGLQKFGYIPEAQSDFIFSAFSEEVGFLGNLMLLWLYFYLCYYFLHKLQYIRDEYTKLMWVGIISLIMVQMFVNIWVNLKIMPNTWLTLPFISYGWTALMVNVIEIMLLYKIVKSKPHLA